MAFLRPSDPFWLSRLGQPTGVTVLGDTHGDAAMVGLLPRLVGRMRRISGLGPEDTVGIIQLGDFGFWPHTTDWMAALSRCMAREDVNAAMWFLDGNHEHHHMLAELADDDLMRGPDGEFCIHDRLGWLPRGTRWEWSGRRLAAMGGAVSIDQDGRTYGHDWFEEEAITYGQYRRFEAHGGKVDVLFAHDAPSAELPWSNLLAGQHGRVYSNSTSNRMTLAEVAACCEADLVVHGHWHVRSDYVAHDPGRGRPYRVEAMGSNLSWKSMSGWLDLARLNIGDPPDTVRQYRW